MAVDVIMPQMGESIFEGTITKWLKKAGDKIERDEPLFEISTDKVDAEIPSPSAGVLKEIKVGEGQTVPIQTVVAVIEASDGASSSAPAAAPAKPAAATPAPPSAAAKSAAPAPSAPAPAAQQPQAAAPSGEKVRSSPLVRKIARENNIDVTQVPGTGAGGRVSKSDILSAVQGGGPPAVAASASPVSAAPSALPGRPTGVPSASGGASASAVLESAVPREKMYFGHYEVQPMSVMRQRIAEHMVLSKRVSPHVYSVDEADMTAIATLRAKMKNKFEETTGTKLTFMPFFVRAAVEALRAFPTVNSSVDGTNIVLHKECNIGIAVALDWGLIVPVIKNAEEKNFLGIARTMNDLA
jgi:pyruvate dehydrogenase E2 component (dihydrolipoamide acetyltransferase)